MKSNKISKEILKYTVIFEPAEEGGYVVSVPALPGCITQGDTFEEAVEMAQDAISLYLSVLGEEGKKAPIELDDIVVTKVSVPSPMFFHQ